MIGTPAPAIRVLAAAGVGMVLAVTGLAATPALGQEDTGVVTVDFDVGAYDAAAGDWPVTDVVVAGPLDENEPFTVDLFAGSDVLLWSGTTPFAGDATSIAVDTPVVVGELASVRVSQRQTVVAIIEVGDPVESAPAAPIVPPAPPDVEGVQVEQPPPSEVPRSAGPRAEVLNQGSGSGAGGSGQLAVSMVLAVVVIAIVFRSPLPSATVQRWTR